MSASDKRRLRLDVARAGTAGTGPTNTGARGRSSMISDTSCEEGVGEGRPVLKVFGSRE